MSKLYLIENVVNFLYQKYNPNNEERAMGVLLAGKGSDDNWYVDTALDGHLMGLFAKDETLAESLIKEYLINAKENQKLILWLEHYDKRTEILKEFMKEFIHDPFDDLVVIKPTVKSYDIEYLQKKQNIILAGSWESITVHQHDPEAKKNIDELQEGISSVIKYLAKSLETEH